MRTFQINNLNLFSAFKLTFDYFKIIPLAEVIHEISFCTPICRILDDIEMYEHQKPFSLQELITISAFLNNFTFRIIWNNLLGKLEQPGFRKNFHLRTLSTNLPQNKSSSSPDSCYFRAFKDQ